MARKPLPSVVPTDRITPPDRGRRCRRFLLGALIAAALAVAMSGCVILKSVTSSQLNVIGKVQITTVLCATDTGSNNAGYAPADATCQGNTTAQKGNSNSDSTNNAAVQLKLAYRIPNAATAPSTFTSTNTSSPPTTPCGSGIVFNQSSSYASALEALSPAGSGKKWVGYISTAQTFTTAGCQYVTVAPQFTLGQVFGVLPFQSPFTYRVVTGYRTVDEATPGSTSARTVTCGSNAFATYADGVDGGDADTNGDQSGICVDQPQGGASAISTDQTQATRDLGVFFDNTSTHAGATATVPFHLFYNGAAGAGPFSISASTNVPGATATPSITTLTPSADSTTDMTVSVPVPANTSPGSYTVNVTATLGSETRGTVPATLTVGQNFTFDTAPALPSLGTIALNGQAQTKTAQMNNFSVNDTTASPSGWNVTVAGDSSVGKSAVFKQYCNNGASACGSDPANSYVSGGRVLSANSLSLNSTSASWTGGTGSAPTFPCGGGSCAIDSATPTKIASAANGSAGTGLWSTSGFTSSSVSLATPSTLRVLPANEQYRLNVVWTLNSGP